MRALAGEQKGDGWWPLIVGGIALTHSGEQELSLWGLRLIGWGNPALQPGGQTFVHFADRRAGNAQAMGKVSPRQIGGVTEISKRVIGSGAEQVNILLRQSDQRLWTFGRKIQQVPRPR